MADEYPDFPEVDGVEYRHIPDYPGYAAGSDGTVISVRSSKDQWRALSIATNRKYHVVYIRHKSGKMKTQKVHRLVLSAFYGPCPKGKEGTHYPDPDTTNNTPGNLKWRTRKENTQDSIDQGTHVSVTRKVNRCLICSTPTETDICNKCQRFVGQEVTS